ncbi:DNA polymerase III subunit delta' [Desulfofundulus thermocisternus]|uniref:DNA polymerase III subunit delta' n=1 Tax=Desulfofundulus thermocisternus TaxID=42471 RepID=UPI00217D98A3|nr:DNA polymerase III subunit delta' [Desulfofundulus thermocisternus]MCS5696866.1 DNA polymerase III subunit delta' [Desulfofundulus thermocisternus]
MKLADLTGHEEIIRALRRAVEQNRASHAYLFAGPEGVGKTTTALAFGAALLCRNPEQGDACGRCRDCRQVAARNHPDLHRLVPEGASIKIGQVREVLRLITLSPFQGQRQVFVVEQSDLMTREAANCLLKTLEEPPAGTVLILISDRPHALLPTIISRCQVLTFQPLLPEQVSVILKRVTDAPDEEVELLSRFSGGCPGRAVRLAGTEGGYFGLRQRMLELAAGLNRASLAEALQRAAAVAGDKEDALTCLELFLLWYRDLLVCKETGTPELLFNRDLFPLIDREARIYSRGQLLRVIKEIEKTRDSLLANVNTRLAMEMLFMRLAGAG